MSEGGETHFSVLESVNQDVLKDASGGNTFEDITRVLRETPTLFRTARHLYSAHKEHPVNARERAMSILYGEFARPLGDKGAFPHIVRNIGYTAPDSVLIRASLSQDERADKVGTYYEEKDIPKFFCKPLAGTWQRDLAEFDSHDSKLDDYLKTITEDTLVQEFVPHEKVLRYMRYKDKNGKVFVAAFEFTEDDSENKKNIKVPFGTRLKIASHGVDANEYLSTVANLTAIPLPNDQGQREHLDTLMDGFIQALEDKLDGQLPFFSCDIGIRDMNTLAQPYDEDAMRKNIVFFETQSAPDSWEYRSHNIQKPVRTYANLWRLFVKEHGAEMLQRAKALTQAT